MAQPQDFIVFRPPEVDLTRSPLRKGIDEPTYVLGAFNPGFTRLPNGNLLLMVRVAEALSEPVVDGQVRAVRWSQGRYLLDAYPLAEVDMTDPRQFALKHGSYDLLALTSLSWLLPVELTPDGHEIVAVHYDRAIEPSQSFQQYGVEDPRISVVDGRYYMTTCSVSAERLCSTLYTSADAMSWTLEGIVLDHQNKDMILFEGKVGGRFMALTRPLGGAYFVYPPDSPYDGGPSIHFAQSPDALHWKPLDDPGIRPRRGSRSSMRVGGGSPPVLTERGWLMLYHGVERAEQVGIYRTYWAILNRDDPTDILCVNDDDPLIEAKAELCRELADQMYLPTPVVFTTGIVDAGEHYIVASGEADLACRLTFLPKSRFA
jgi:beta-1,2-mannobiose phosphorylase / 1,2-beta-oligomannan phosphorylase